MILSETDMPAIFSAIAFFTMLILFGGIYQFHRVYSKKRGLKQKIHQSDLNLESATQQRQLVGDEGKLKGRVLNFLGYLGKQVSTEKTLDYSGMRVKFLRAGIRRINAPAVFWGTKLFLASVLSIAFFMIRITVLNIFEPVIVLGGCAFLFLLGFCAPDIWLHLRTEHRKSKILDGFPDALDLLVICVEAGMGMDAAINRVAEEIRLTNSVLSDEFKILNLEMRAGKSRQDALRNLTVRTDLDEINSLVTLLIQTDRFGTSLAQTLRVYSDSFRTKRFQKAEEIAAKLPVKLVFPTVLFIFPTMFIVILGPAAIRIYQTLLQT